MAHRLSARGAAALAIFAVRTAELQELGLRVPQPGSMRLESLSLGDGLEENALVVGLSEARAEIHVHGGPRIVERIEALLEMEEDAPSSELAMRASTKELLLLALSQQGAGGWPALREQARRGGAAPLRAELLAAEDRWRRALPYLFPRRVLLRGPSNSGKSTLFNLLVGRQRVRVGPQLGLTRDSVEEPCVLDGLPIVLVDSAGDAEGLGEIDAEALRRARIEEKTAALLLRLLPCIDGDLASSSSEGEIRVFTREDEAASRARELGAAGHIVCDLRCAGEDLRRQLGRELRERLAPEPCPSSGACPLSEAEHAELQCLLGGA
ncbi:MAG: hypothetical protein CSA62_03550 [Planctomycetota bacterium]|nr:MAG: hypothetical protein CSA62_03550 [Planctomycetota bacterium]